MIARLILLLAMVLGLSGCIIPYRFTPRQGAVGVVVEEGTDRAIAGASIVIITGGSDTTAVSGKDGRFEILGVRKWGVYIVPTDLAPLPWSIAVTAIGYRPYSMKDTTTVMADGSRELGEIKLEKE